MIARYEMHYVTTAPDGAQFGRELWLAALLAAFGEVCWRQYRALDTVVYQAQHEREQANRIVGGLVAGAMRAAALLMPPEKRHVHTNACCLLKQRDANSGEESAA